QHHVGLGLPAQRVDVPTVAPDPRGDPARRARPGAGEDRRRQHGAPLPLRRRAAGGRLVRWRVMGRIIDMGCTSPRGATDLAPAAGAGAGARLAPGASAPGPPSDYGMANYGRIFRSRRAGADDRPDVDLDAYVERLSKLGIVRAVPFGVENDETG